MESPVTDAAFIDHSAPDLVNDEEDLSLHDHKKRKKRDSDENTEFVAHDHSSHANNTVCYY